MYRMKTQKFRSVLLTNVRLDTDTNLVRYNGNMRRFKCLFRPYVSLFTNLTKISLSLSGQTKRFSIYFFCVMMRNMRTKRCAFVHVRTQTIEASYTATHDSTPFTLFDVYSIVRICIRIRIGWRGEQSGDC